MLDQLIIIGLFGLIGLTLAYFGDKGNPYPPRDDRGRPMLLSFSARSGRAVWVRRHESYDSISENKEESKKI